MIEIKRCVLDATVATKWFLKDEHDTSIADDILLAFINGTLQLHVPAIFQYEVSGALKKACATSKNGRQRIESTDTLLCVRELYALPFLVHFAQVDEAVESVDMALRFSKGYYDMLYLQLACKLDCQCVTADKRLIEAIPSEFPRAHVCLLSDWHF